MKPEPKLHIRDIRLYNNAGISVPVCVASGSIPNKIYFFALSTSLATCKRCPKAMLKSYPWAKR